jgi:hypothetical protein
LVSVNTKVLRAAEAGEILNINDSKEIAHATSDRQAMIFWGV